MRDLIHTLLTWSATFGAEGLAGLALKSTVLLGVAGLAALGLRRAGASARHLVWALAFAGLLALPVVATLLPPLRLGWMVPAAPVDAGASLAAATASVRATETAATDPATLARDPGPASDAHDAASSVAVAPVPIVLAWLSGRRFAVAAWVLGVLAVLASLVGSLVRVRAMGRRAQVVDDPAWLALVRGVAAEAGVRRPVLVRRSPAPGMPMTWGVWRAVVLLPADADAWSAERRRDVLRHELAHVARQDVLVQLVARVACAAYWFNPFVWLAARALRAERERACDDHVLRAGTRPSDYATHLLEVARAARAARLGAVAAVAMARPSQLAGRLLDVLDERRRRSTVTARQAVLAAGGTLLLVVPLGAVAPAVQATATPAVAAAAIQVGAASSAPVVRTIESLPAASAEMASLLADTLPECVGDARRGERRSVHVEHGVAVTTVVGRCTLRFIAEGKVRFNEDFTDVVALETDGSLSLETDNGDVERRLEVRARNGSLERRYHVNGTARPYDAEARRWVAGALTVVFRSSGIAAEERARWILERQGPDGLLQELDELRGDYTRRRYAQFALVSGRLDAAGTERLLSWAGRSISSDYELAELLITAARGPLAPGAQAAFVAAARTLDSDYERRRALSVALARAGLDGRGAAAVLEAAVDMDSDYELAQLLIQWQRGRALDESLRPTFFRAAGSLESDYEHRRVLAVVIGRGDAGAAVVADALASAKTIDSDYELAELLTAVAELYALDAPLRPAFFAAVESLQSDFERGRVLKALAQRGDVGPAVVTDVLRASGTMQSGYERAEVLIAVATQHRLDDAQRAAFMEAARGLGDYEYDRVMGALARHGGRAPI